MRFGQCTVAIVVAGAALALLLWRRRPLGLRKSNLKADQPPVCASVPVPATRSFRSKHASLYVDHAARYDDEICRCQDYAGNILTAIQAIVALTPATRVVDVGTGTGKLCRLLAPHVASVVGLDRSEEMIAVACARSQAARNVRFELADVRQLPLTDSCSDVLVAGWTYSYLKSEGEEWYPDGTAGGAWREELGRALTEAERVLVPGGTVIVLETQGTAAEKSRRTGSWLYAYLREIGFQETVIRTDYRFPSRETALQALLFFFGRGVATRAKDTLVEDRATGECVVAECTGLWWRQKREVQ